MTSGRTIALTAGALTGFAANSILGRMALAAASIDAVSFTSIRLLSGAATMLALVALTRREPAPAGEGGRWSGALALFAYAIAFSWAYLRLDAGVGALVLFAAVQVTMLTAAVASGDRLGTRIWIGLGLAAAGLVILTRPGGAAPDPWGSAAMAAAGVAWGIYSLLGRGVARPLLGTAGNFARAAPLALVVSAITWSSIHVTPTGALLAIASGALASGIGYSLWYAALPDLGATRAAIVQLLVPVLAAAAGVALLGEVVTPRLVVAAAAILGGVALAVRR